MKSPHGRGNVEKFFFFFGHTFFTHSYFISGPLTTNSTCIYFYLLLSTDHVEADTKHYQSQNPFKNTNIAVCCSCELRFNVKSLHVCSECVCVLRINQAHRIWEIFEVNAGGYVWFSAVTQKPRPRLLICDRFFYVSTTISVHETLLMQVLSHQLTL